MFEVGECIARYQRLLQLMEDDSEEIAQGLQGELLEAYQDLVKREKTILQNALRSIQNTY